MAYNTEILKEKAIDLIKKNKLLFIEDVVAMLGISKPTFYTHFPVETDEFNNIRGLLELNKAEIKISIRYKWSKSDNPTAQMALYKLCSTKEEHMKLQQNYTDHTTDGEKIQTTTIVFKDYDNEE